MAKIKLHILEVPRSSDVSSFDLLGLLGSEPLYEGQAVEGVKVPSGVIWLFPTGGNYAPLEKLMTGVRKTITVNIS